MGVRVDENLERVRDVLHSGDSAVAALVLLVDDEIDAMGGSLRGRCRTLLGHEALDNPSRRFVESVLRVASELECVGDLALRVIKVAPKQGVLVRSETVRDIVLTVANVAVERFRMSLRAWSGQDLGLATELLTHGGGLDHYYDRVTRELERLHHPDAARTAVGTLVVVRALERIADHSTVIGASVQHLVTSAPLGLASEVG